MINRFEDYVWIDFIRDSQKVYNSFEDLKNMFISKFPKVVAFIGFQNGYYLKKDTCEDLHSRIETLKLKFRIKRESFDSKTIITRIDVIKIMDLMDMDDISPHIPIYKKETFRPNDFRLQRGEYNTYTGMKGETRDLDDFKYDDEKVKPIKDFIYEVISNSNSEHFKYIISWLSHIVCKPERKTGIALFLHSNEKGTGKSSLGEFLKSHVFGHHISNVISGLSKLTQKHNTVIQRKILTVVEELPSVSGEFHSQFDTMKHIITDNNVTIEPKGVDPYEIPNYVNLLMLSNNMMSLKLENGDRRYACFQVSPCKKTDFDYWLNLHENVLNEEGGKHFYHYLKNIPDEDKVSLYNIPNTDIRSQLIENSRPSHEQFFIDIKNGEEEIGDNMYLPEFAFRKDIVKNAITPDNLYRCYEVYCNKRKEPVLRRRLFVNSINKFVEKGATTTKDRKKLTFYLIK